MVEWYCKRKVSKHYVPTNSADASNNLMFSIPLFELPLPCNGLVERFNSRITESLLPTEYVSLWLIK